MCRRRADAGFDAPPIARPPTAASPSGLPWLTATHPVGQEYPDVPESSSRKKATYIPPPAKSSGPKVNPPWFVPVMIGLMVLGLVWIVVTYLWRSQYPIPGIEQW